MLYNQLIQEGKFKVVVEPIYISEYMEDGLTKNIRKLWIKNYVGVIESLIYKYEVCKKYNLLNRCISRSKCILHINSICIARKVSIWKFTPNKFGSFMLLIPSIIIKVWKF